MLNIPETVQDTGIVSMGLTHAVNSTVLFRMTLTDLAKYYVTRSVTVSKE